MTTVTIQTAGIAVATRQRVAVETTHCQNLVMIHDLRRRPALRRLVVAQLAIVGGGDMTAVFAGGKSTVVATDAIVEDIGVIDRGPQPSGGVMAGITLIRGRYMGGGLAARRRAVMTRAATSQHLTVIDGYHWRPRRRSHRMASIAKIRGVDMPAGFVVTACAGAHHLGMVNTIRGYRPPARGVLVVAGIT